LSEWEPSLGASDEWFTPKYIFDALGVLFDLDVAAPWGGTRHVPARAHLSSSSLERVWFGFLWMNAPFGGRNGLEPWLEKFVEHGDGIALVPDRTSAPWFQRFAPSMSAILFLSPKVKFERPDGSVGKSPGSGTALMSAGSRGRDALYRARALGLLVEVAKAA
jgi:hypothetical protein